MNTNIDRSNMRQVILDSPKQLAEGLELAKGITVKGKFNKIIVCGMGGSALPADMIMPFINNTVPLLVNKNYGLPKIADKESLIICISYSGNTEETVSALQEALENKYSAIGMATGGKIEEICKNNKIPFVKIPAGIQPRSAVGYIFSALAKLLSNHKLMEDISEDLLATAKDLERVSPEMEKEGKLLAEKLLNKIPIIYASENNRSLAQIWKIRFNENSKAPAFYNVFPELNHNEMTGYAENKELNGQFYAIIIKDAKDHPRNLRRMDLTADILREVKMDTTIIDSVKGSETSKLFASLMLSDWTSYHLALIKSVDPSPVPMVEDFKKRLS